MAFLIEFESVDVLRDLGQVGGGVVVVGLFADGPDDQSGCPLPVLY